MDGIEPSTSPLPRVCSTPELHELIFHRPHQLERVVGIEPTPSAWKAEVLPLNYTRLPALISACRNSAATSIINLVEGEGFEPSKLSRQIYSLLPLATREPLRTGSKFYLAASSCQAIVFTTLTMDPTDRLAFKAGRIMPKERCRCNDHVDLLDAYLASRLGRILTSPPVKAWRWSSTRTIRLPLASTSSALASYPSPP